VPAAGFVTAPRTAERHVARYVGHGATDLAEIDLAGPRHPLHQHSAARVAGQQVEIGRRQREVARQIGPVLRRQVRQFARLRLGLLPSGSGNGLAISLAVASGLPSSWWTAAQGVAKRPAAKVAAKPAKKK
jgi:hypothetical protein